MSKKSLQELEEEYIAQIEEIKKIIEKKNSNEDPEARKNEFCKAYGKLASIAKEASEKCAESDPKKSKQYNDRYNAALVQASKNGSVRRLEIPKTTFDDVKGLQNVKDIIDTFMFMSQNPDLVKYYKIKGGLGLLMYGAPGTGKTMIAEAIANKMQLPLLTVSPSDIFKSYVGQSEQAVKHIFEELDSCVDGAILFVDECESIFSIRKADTQDYKAAVTNELLQRINGLGVDGSKRILIGATNRPEMIDPAYLRYKRFSHQIHVEPPDRETIEAIVSSKLKGIDLDGITVAEVVDMIWAEMHVKVDSPVVGSPYVRPNGSHYSAADVCGIVEETCRLAMGVMIKNNQSGSSKGIPLTKEMFVEAIKSNPPSISAEDFKLYLDFAKKKGK